MMYSPSSSYRAFWALVFLVCLLGLAACGSESTGAQGSGVDADLGVDMEDDTAVDCADPCDPMCADASDCVLPAVRPGRGDLLIEEFYYSGAFPAGGTDHYFSDQFIELVNTTEGALDLSGVMIGDASGPAGEINPGTRPAEYTTTYPDQVVLSSVWRIPEGTRLEPGARVLVAHDGTNHRPFSTVDLSAAGFETFVKTSGRDEDHPTVHNLESVVFNGGFDWLVPVFGASIVVVEPETVLGVVPGPFGDLPTVPVESVLDAVEALMDDSSMAFKRLPTQVDSGFAFVAGTYTGESLHRVQSDGVWQDTDNSADDFVVGPPDPYRAPDPQGVLGEVSVELGTGYYDFVSLDDGDEVELIMGIQGGWHLDASVRLRGLDPDGVVLLYDAVDSTGERISFETQALLVKAGMLPEDEGWLRLGDRIVLDITDAGVVEGTTVTMRVTAQLEGRTWSDERTVVVTYALP